MKFSDISTAQTLLFEVERKKYCCRTGLLEQGLGTRIVSCK